MLQTLMWAAVVVLLLAGPAAANGPRIVEANDNEILIELATDDYSIERVVHGGESFSRIRVMGYGETVEPGLPRLPRKGVLLGVPFGAELSLDIVSLETDALGRHRVEPAPIERIEGDEEFPIATQEFRVDEGFYSSGANYPGAVASLGPQSTFRHQRVVQIHLNPFHYSPRTGDLTLHRRIVARLRIRDVGRPRGVTTAVRHERDWEAVYAGTILNYEQAKSWRARREPQRAHMRLDLRQDHEAYRLWVDETGMYRLDFSELAAEGLAGTLPVDEIGVYHRSYDAWEDDPFIETPTSIVVVDADEDGFFDGSDYLLFYALSFEDGVMVEGYEDRYTTNNVYWFGWGEEVATRMDTRPGWLDEPGLTAPASFRDTLRFEEDPVFDTAPPSDLIDYWYWTNYLDGNDEHELPFRISDIDGSGDVYMRARYQGRSNTQHRIDFSIENGLGVENYVDYFQFSGVSFNMSEDIYANPSTPVPSSYFTDGANTLLTAGSLGPNGRSGANLDWFEFDYMRNYMSDAGRLACTNAGETGVSEFEVGGFAADALRLFDVTDPWAPAELTLGEANIVPDGGGYRLIFQDDVASFTRYEAREAGNFRDVLDTELRHPANLFADEADLVVVSYDGFYGGVEPLVAYRESQGYVVSHARLEEVYDEFSGGLPTHEAIKSYLSYALDEWERQPQFAILVGDASEDTREMLDTSSPNYMPTYLFTGSTSDPKMRSSDQWFVSREGPLYLPEIMLGRLPVGSSSQLENVVSKIIDYEDYGANDNWRNEVLLVADDAWSYGSIGSLYQRKSIEDRFRTVSLELSDMVDMNPAGVDTIPFILSRYTDPYHGEVTSGDFAYAFQTAGFVRAEATPDLLGLITDGVNIMNFEGHGNRTQLTHEQLLLASTFTNDVSSMNNVGKPFIFLGFSCELSRFTDTKEGTSVDSVTEQMLLRSSGQGAVGTFACTSVAYLGPNALYNEKVFEAFFLDPTPEGSPDENPWPRWSLGAMVTKGTVKVIAEGTSSTPERTYIFFGDPISHVEMSPPSLRVTVDGEPYFTDDYYQAGPLEPTVLIIADLIDEVEIDPASIGVAESDLGPVDPEDYTVEAVSDTTAEQSRWYRLTYETTIRNWTYDIRITATDVNGQKTTFVLHVVEEGNAIRLERVANHPNPFAERTSIIYNLNQVAENVRISIYTVGGRLIKTFRDASRNANYNAVEWDGRDDQGDTVANGLYLYVIEVEGEDLGDGPSRVTSDVGRMAKIR